MNEIKLSLYTCQANGLLAWHAANGFPMLCGTVGFTLLDRRASLGSKARLTYTDKYQPGWYIVDIIHNSDEEYYSPIDMIELRNPEGVWIYSTDDFYPYMWSLLREFVKASRKATAYVKMELIDG